MIFESPQSHRDFGGFLICHSEQSEESIIILLWILRCTQNDILKL
jgi:hypothetical protein